MRESIVMLLGDTSSFLVSGGGTGPSSTCETCAEGPCVRSCCLRCYGVVFEVMLRDCGLKMGSFSVSLSLSLSLSLSHSLALPCLST